LVYNTGDEDAQVICLGLRKKKNGTGKLWNSCIARS
jgi:hypothetical protein